MEWHELYDKDFYAWALENAHLLRQGDLEDTAKLDRLNIAVELEQIAMREKRLLVTRLSDLILSLIRWQVQGLMRSGSFRLNIEIQREDVLEVLTDNPSLMERRDEILRHSYRRAYLAAMAITGFAADHFSESCPYAFAQIMDEDFFPENHPDETG
jgi:hypothetical protein